MRAARRTLYARFTERWMAHQRFRWLQEGTTSRNFRWVLEQVEADAKYPFHIYQERPVLSDPSQRAL